MRSEETMGISCNHSGTVVFLYLVLLWIPDCEKIFCDPIMISKKPIVDNCDRLLL